MEAQNFGSRLRELRTRLGLSLRELGDIVSIDYTYLSKIENGVLPPPSEKVIAQLAEALNADKDELLILAGKIPTDIIPALRNRKTLRHLRAVSSRSKTKSSGSKRETGQHVASKTRGLTGLKALSPMNYKGLARVVVPIILVIAIATSLWYTAPVSALDITFPSLPSSGTLGSSYTFNVKVTIADDELLPVQNINLYMYNSSDPTTYKATCTNLPLTDGGSKSYSTSQTSGGDTTVTASGTNWEYFTGYGNVNWGGYAYYFSPPNVGGYGYSGVGEASITYNVSWTPPSDWPDGTYKIELKITANGDTFVRTSSGITLSMSSGGGGAPPLPPEEIDVDVIVELPPADAADAIEQMDDTEAAGLIEDVVEQEGDADKAADIFENMNLDKTITVTNNLDTSTATQIMEKVSDDKTAAILEGVASTDNEKAAEIMEGLSTEKLDNTIGKMSEDVLKETLPGLSVEKLEQIDKETLLNALPTVRTEQLTTEDPPVPPADATDPVIVYTTPSGGTYLAVRTFDGDWVVVVKTPLPVKQVMIKTKAAHANVNTEIQILTERPATVSVLPAGQTARAYINVSFTNIPLTDIELGHLTFWVEKTWLEQNSLHKWSVTLYHYDATTKKWSPMPTKRVSEDADKVYYTAVVTQFSTFAISGSQTASEQIFRVANLQITPGQVASGSPVTISVDITNMTGAEETFVVTLWVNNTVETGKQITLAAGGTQKVSFTVTKQPVGDYQVRLDRLFGNFNVIEKGEVPKKPAAFTVTKMSVTPAEVEIGKSVTISAVVTNTGELTGTYEVVLTIDGKRVTSETVSLAGGNTKTVSFNVSEDAAGTYAVSVNNEYGAFKVTAPVKPVNWWLLAGIIIAFIAIVTTIIIARRRRYVDI